MVGEAKPGEEWHWYTAKTGGTSAANPTEITAYTPEGTTTTYYISSKNKATDCESARVEGTVTVSANPANMDPGAGSLSGRTCFDIAESNFGSVCGDSASRKVLKANFAALTDADKKYTFTANGSGSNLHFVVDDPYKCLVEASPWSGTGISGNFTSGAVATLTLNYKPTLNAHVAATGDPLIYGLTRSDAVWVNVYAVFNDGNGTVSVQLTVKIQDCICGCPAQIDGGKWLTFQCHNLGGEDIYPDMEIKREHQGDWYRFGASTASIANEHVSDYPTPITWDDESYQTSDDWYTHNNPCPQGYRIPTQSEWNAVIDQKNNARKVVGIRLSGSKGHYNAGFQFGDWLVLPAAGLIWINGSLKHEYGGYSVIYWASNSGVAGYGESLTSVMGMDTLGTRRENGLSVRCVSK
jgi:uncharacterized protein (TIGR02145 family)